MVEHTVTATRIEINPEERKRRLSRVYTILLDLAHRAEAAEQENPGEAVQTTACDIPAATGE